MYIWITRKFVNGPRVNWTRNPTQHSVIGLGSEAAILKKYELIKAPLYDVEIDGRVQTSDFEDFFNFNKARIDNKFTTCLTYNATSINVNAPCTSAEYANFLLGSDQNFPKDGCLHGLYRDIEEVGILNCLEFLRNGEYIGKGYGTYRSEQVFRQLLIPPQEIENLLPYTQQEAEEYFQLLILECQRNYRSRDQEKWIDVAHKYFHVNPFLNEDLLIYSGFYRPDYLQQLKHKIRFTRPNSEIYYRD